MARSERRGLASEALVREMTRQLAAAAPPAPGWGELQRRLNRAGTTRQPSTRPRLALVAALSALVVSGLWWMAGRTTEPTTPIDRPDPAPTTVVAPPAPDPIAAWRRWVADTAPASVQLCLVRTSSNLTAASDLPSPNARPGLEGDTPAKREMSWHSPSQTMLAAVVEHPDLDPVVADEAALVVATFSAADEAQYAKQGEPSDEFSSIVEAFLAERNSNAALRPSADTCWLDSNAGVDLIASPATGLDASETLLCLAAAQLDHATFVAAIDPAGGFDAIAETAGQALMQSFPRGLPDAVIDVVGEIQDALLTSAAEQGDRLDRARLTLAELDVPVVTDDCPLTPVTVSARTSPTDSQPPSEESP